MQNGALRKVTELAHDTRQAMESIIGRSLQEDEAISINVYKLAPTGQAREEASRRLLERIDKTAKKVQGVPEEEIDAAIDEAADHVGHHPEWESRPIRDSRSYERESHRTSRRLLEIILAGPHDLVLSEFLVQETARVLRYPRMQNLYKLAADDIAEQYWVATARADLVSPVVHKSIVLADPNDDPVAYTAVAGRADVLCTLDRDFYTTEVGSFCRNEELRSWITLNCSECS